MLRSFSVVLGASLLLTACGGGGGGGGGSKSSAAVSSNSVVGGSSVSSAVKSSSNSSAVVLSSLSNSSAVSSSPVSSSPSSSISSSPTGPAVIDLPVASWYQEKNAGFAAGVVSVTTQWQGAGYYLNLPVPELEFATIEVTVAVDNAFKVSGSGLSLWAVVDADPWPGKTDCAAVESSALVEGVDTKVTCVLDSGNVFAQTAAAVKLGIQATATAPAGTFTIKSARILLTKASDFSSSSSSSSSVEASASSANSSSNSVGSSASSVNSVASSAVTSSTSSAHSSSSIASSTSSAHSSSSIASSASSAASSQTRIELNGSWYAEGTSAVTWPGPNPSVAPTAVGAGAGYYMSAPVVNLENSTVNLVVNVDAAFKNSGASLQIWASVVGNAATTGCAWLNNGDLVAGQDATVTCTLSYSHFNQTSAAVKFGLQAVGAAPAGSFLIKGRYITLP